MPLLTRNPAPAPPLGNPEQEFEGRFRDLLAQLAGVRRELEQARSELADATLAQLMTGEDLAKVGRLDKKVAELDSRCQALEATCDRARAVQKLFQAKRDAQTLEAVQAQRAEVRAAWQKALERQSAIVSDLARVIAEAQTLEDEDRTSANLERDLRARSLGRGRIIPAVTGGASTMVAVEYAPKAIAEAIRQAREQAIP
jgi:dGTP triphosphohydrolase